MYYDCLMKIKQCHFLCITKKWKIGAALLTVVTITSLAIVCTVLSLMQAGSTSTEPPQSTTVVSTAIPVEEIRGRTQTGKYQYF